MTRKEKHLSVLAIYLADLERKYEKEFKRMGENGNSENCKVLINLYHEIEEVRKEIEQLKYN